MQEAKRQKVSDLLRAHVTYSEITRITGASSKTISKVKKSLEAGIDLKAPHSVLETWVGKKKSDSYVH